MADLYYFIRFILALPFLYLAPKLHPTMPSVALSLFSVNWAIWFTFGMITPRHTDVRLGKRSHTGDCALSFELRARERHLSEPRESLARPSFRPFTLQCDLTVSHLFLRWRFKTSAKAVARSKRIQHFFMLFDGL